MNALFCSIATEADYEETVCSFDVAFSDVSLQEILVLSFDVAVDEVTAVKITTVLQLPH